jgi:hypothetical protein
MNLKHMGLRRLVIRMEILLKGILLMELEKGRELREIKMELIMMDTIRMMYPMDLVFIIGLRKRSMKEIGKMGCFMVKERK